MTPSNDSDKLEASCHPTGNNDDSSIPEISLSFISSLKNATATPQNNTGLTGISSQPLLITQPTIVDGALSTPGRQVRGEEKDWLHCFSPPTDPSFFIPTNKRIHSSTGKDDNSGNVFKDYYSSFPSKDEQVAIYDEMCRLYSSFDHKEYPFAAVQLKVALFVLVNAIAEKEETFIEEGNMIASDDNDLGEKKRQTRLFLQQIWKNARTTIISAKAHIKYHDPDCRI